MTRLATIALILAGGLVALAYPVACLCAEFAS